MTIDIKSIFIDTFLNMFENNIALILLAFVASIIAYIFRRNIAYEFDLTRREKSKLIEKTLLISILIGVSTNIFLYIKEYYFLLSVLVSTILTYTMYKVGIIDAIAEKLEGQYGR